MNGTAEESHELVENFFSSACEVADFMEQQIAGKLLLLLNPPLRDQYLAELYRRGLCWMSSLRKLNDAKDFQGLCVCTRTLFETTIDFLLIHADTTDESATQMKSWELSAKLKVAKALIDFEVRRKTPLQIDTKPHKDYIQLEESAILSARKKFWPNQTNNSGQSVHPDRWTGRAIVDDAKAADKIYPTQVQQIFDQTLEDFYETQIRTLHWYVHGSTVIGTRNMQTGRFPELCGLNFRYSSQLALIMTQIMMEELSRLGVLSVIPALTDEFRRVRKPVCFK